GMIANEGHPPLRRDLGSPRVHGHVTTDRARRNLNSDLQQELIRDAFLSQVGLPEAISTINLRTSVGTLALPLDRDFQFQKKRKPFRCQRINVSGLTTVRTERQSKNLVR